MGEGFTMPEVPVILTVPEVSEMLRIGKAQVYGAIERGELRAGRFGRVLRVREKDVWEWFEATGVRELRDGSISSFASGPPSPPPPDYIIPLHRIRAAALSGKPFELTEEDIAAEKAYKEAYPAAMESYVIEREAYNKSKEAFNRKRDDFFNEIVLESKGCRRILRAKRISGMIWSINLI